MVHVSNAFTAIGKNKVAEIKNLLEKLKLRSPVYLHIKFKTCLYARIFELSFSNDWVTEKGKLKLLARLVAVQTAARILFKRGGLEPKNIDNFFLKNVSIGKRAEQTVAT